LSAEAELLRGEGGGDVPNFEPKLSQIDPFFRKLRKIYEEKPALFDMPKSLIKF